jgi:hypothetical protein
MRRTTLVLLLVVALLPTFPRRLPAQGENAIALAPGTLRISFVPDWTRWNTRWGTGTPGFTDGSLEPLGVDFSADTSGVFGANRLPFLSPAENELRGLTGLAGFAINLGRTTTVLNASVRVMPISLELALSRRLVVSATVPLVRSRVEAFFTVDTASALLGNVGWNPAYWDPLLAATFRDQVDSALVALLREATQGPPSLQAQAQAAYDSLRPLLCPLYGLAAGAPPSTASPCFGIAPQVPTPFLPLEGSEAGDSLTLRVQRGQQSYAALAAQYAAMGITLPPFTEGYALPDSVLDTLGFRRLFSDPLGPLAGDSLTTVVRTRLGDVETGLTLQLADRRRFRAQLGVLLRLPTGYVDSKDNFIDLGTGDHQTDVELSARTDLVLGPQFWIHAGGRFGAQLEDELERRVTQANFPLVPPSSTARLRRDLGDYVQVDVVPTWQLDDAFAVALGWHYYHQAPARFSYVDPADEARIGLPASVLEQETGLTAMRVGVGITFSTLARYAAGRASLPYTVTASYQNTFGGDGGAAPKASLFRLVMRGYLSLW